MDRYLEHARVFVFLNNGDHRVFLGSADWMKRNLRRRVECVFPVYDPDLKKELLDMLNIQLSDNVKACEIDDHLMNNRIVTKGPDIRAQISIYEYFKNKYTIPKFVNKCTNKHGQWNFKPDSGTSIRKKNLIRSFGKRKCDDLLWTDGTHVCSGLCSHGDPEGAVSEVAFCDMPFDHPEAHVIEPA